VGVLIEGKVYLFDPVLGLPLPGPHGVGRSRDGQLAIEPATLAQVRADEQLLRRMDVGESHPYPVKLADLKRLVVLLEASPPSLTRRMKTLQSRLTAEKRMVLATSPTAAARRWKAALAGVETRLWPRPFNTLRYRSTLPWPGVRMRLQNMLPFFQPPLIDTDRAKTPAPLYCGRVLYLRGKLVPGKVGSESAMSYYNIARPSNEQLERSSVDDFEKLMRVVGKLDASYWSGLVNFQRAHDRSADRIANYKAAAYWFDEQTLQAFREIPGNPWTSGAQYNLARTYEALGDIERAALAYWANDTSPGYHGDLLRAKWLKEIGKDKKDE
jgi:hypothetical protein